MSEFNLECGKGGMMDRLKRWVNRLVLRLTSRTLSDGTLVVWGGEVFDVSNR